MSLVRPEEMTYEQLAIALQNCIRLEEWIHAVRAHAFTVLKNGHKIPGFKLGYGVRRRIWKDNVEERLVKTLLRLPGIEQEELYSQPSLLSPAQIEKVLRFHGFMPKPARNAPKLPSVLDEFITKSMPEPRVLPENEGEDYDAKAAEAAEEFK